MSRSFKKHCWEKCAGDPSFKKIFNRKLRRTTKLDEIPNGKAYKKMNESWEIWDYRCETSWEEFKHWWQSENMTEEEKWAEWKRLYGSK